MHNIHLGLAAVWLVVGAGLVIWSMAQPGSGQPLLVVLCGVLAVYNLMRWFAARSRASLRTIPRRQHRDSEEPPDPTFDFSKDQPPK